LVFEDYDKSKPAARRGRKTRGLASSEVARLPKGTTMQRFFPKLAGGLAAVAVLAAPAMASAHSNPSVESVRAHLRNADQALAIVAERVKDNDNAAAAIAMVRNRRQTQAAAREARRVQGRSKQAKALRLVADQRNENVRVLSAIVDEVSDSAQAAAATTPNSSEAPYHTPWTCPL
jgi:hypothetical protein